MSLLRAFPSRTALTRPRQSVVDVAVFCGVAVLLWIIIRTSTGFSVPFNPANAPATVSTDPSALPYYAARSLLRMFIALLASVIFTFVYATAAARLRRAEKILVPILDILQSVPILGFLSVTITGFIALFPGSELGLECASIFAIFTSQAWNMTFAFYHSLVAQPRDLDAASRLLRLSRWQRFWRVDVPSGMIPLVWNGMMSFGGGWFFLVASEALSVDNHTFVLPGIGAFVATANAQGQSGKIVVAIGVMIVMVIGVNVVFWRPLTAWAERFRVEDSESSEQPRSIVLNLLRRSRLPHLLGRLLGRFVSPVDWLMGKLGVADYPLKVSVARRRAIDVLFAIVVLGLVAWGIADALSYVHSTVGLGEFPHALFLGLITFGRVVLLLIVASVIWVPIGVWIGLNPKVSRLAQPVVQVLASFPAVFLFPIATAVFVATGISLNWGGILLMALGAQWYILFNVIAGASAIPNDLREASASLRLTRSLWWRKLILPGVFSSYIPAASPLPVARGTRPSWPRSSATTPARSPRRASARTSRTPRPPATSRASWSASR
ncbi:MAG TPA: ABC transporter permease subunit [Pseudonocardiaceae bacterium]|jgi:NitT/TauT family transport system permease protein